MPDEASTHYATILDQMMEGHLWLAETLGWSVVVIVRLFAYM